MPADVTKLQNNNMKASFPMTILEVIKPADGSRVVRDAREAVLIGQPPEVLKGILLQKIQSFDTLVLTDTAEKDGSLLNNLEFPLYYFLFMGKGLREGKRLNLVGYPPAISRALRLLRLTLLGPTEAELQAWGTPEELRREWLAAAQHLALKHPDGTVRAVDSFFNILPFRDGVADTGHFRIRHCGTDTYEVSRNASSVQVSIADDVRINPPYQMQQDQVPRELVKLGLEILGSASGFTANEPCTGLALCHNGDYILIDSIPYLDKQLFARGISKNQVSAVFLTHLHDDHCALFPLILMPRRVDIITTREIWAMAMDKLSCNLNWQRETIEEYFSLVEVRPGETTNYYGLEITPHLTVHSIPTIGASFSTHYKGLRKTICVIGDNTAMGTVREMAEAGVVSTATHARLRQIYTERHDLLVADGGAGAIHGDPADALRSDAERVVFVHVEHLANRFNTTFSLASSGKRYIVLEGDAGIYHSLMNHYLSQWLGEPLSNRWSRSILAEEEIRRYNAGDVIIVQEARSRGNVFLILTGYCEVVTREGDELSVVTQLQAGEIIGEMAVITGSHKRNASVVAASPVTVCVFAEDTFNAFITSEGHRSKLLTRWQLRMLLRQLPQFRELVSTVLERIAHYGEVELVAAGTTLEQRQDAWCLLVEGSARFNGHPCQLADEFGCRPFAEALTGSFLAETDCTLLTLSKVQVRQFMARVPQFSYQMRKYREQHEQAEVLWHRGTVESD
jgi:CRP-like cAMP-binding protein